MYFLRIVEASGCNYIQKRRVGEISQVITQGLARGFSYLRLLHPLASMPSGVRVSQFMSDEQSPQPPYPNNVRHIRENEALMSRAQLIQACANLAAHDNVKYVKISQSSLYELEAGTRQPRMSTAATLASALDTSPEALFPLGYDNKLRNPKGNTRIPLDRKRGGRPRTKPKDE